MLADYAGWPGRIGRVGPLAPVGVSRTGDGRVVRRRPGGFGNSRVGAVALQGVARMDGACWAPGRGSSGRTWNSPQPRPPAGFGSRLGSWVIRSSAIEHDTMGEVKVPAHALWRAQTQRAVENFPISGRPLERSQIRALGPAQGGRCSGQRASWVCWTPDVADAIAAAADDVAAGRYDDQFPIDVFQTGSGTSSNMNANEVIATLASRALGSDVHPNDHVNASQSSNDTFPTTIHVAATEAVVHRRRSRRCAISPRRSSGAPRSGPDVVTAGRTHLMDAVPVTLGQQAGAWAAQIRYGIERLDVGYRPARPNCRSVAPPWVRA